MSIPSRPTYTGLWPVAAARRHLVAVQPEGVLAVMAMLDLAQHQGLDVTGCTDVVLAAPESSDDVVALRDRGLTVHASGPKQCDPQTHAFGTLDALLAGGTMGTRLYAAGTETFIGRVVQLAAEHGIDPRWMLTERAGSRARRVQCVHCKTALEAVTTSHVECPSCGLFLLVREHYSQRLAAFQGVCATAEHPSERPHAVEAFS